MKTFEDSTGRAWQLSLMIGSVKRVRDALDVDLLQPEKGDPPTMTRLGTDEMLLADVIVCLLQRQFERLNITEEEVYATFDGTTLLAAHTAFYEEWIDFFHRLLRPERVKAIRKQRKMLEAGIRAVEKRVGQFDAERIVERLMPNETPEEVLNRVIGGGMSTNSPDRSASSPIG